MISSVYYFIFNSYRGQIADALDWIGINQMCVGRYSNILHVIDLILSIAPSSAEAERGFSQLKQIKTNLKSRMNQLILNHTLGIKLLSQDIDGFEPTKAIDLWNYGSVRSRRP